MRNGIDDCLGHNLSRDLIGHRRLRAVLPGSHPEIYFGHDEIHRLINQPKECPLVDMVGGDRFMYLRGVKVHTLHF